MNKLALYFIISGCLISCSTKKELDYKSPNVEQVLLNDYVLLISQYSEDPSYGYTKENPIMTGGGVDRVLNQRRFLNALAGPEGQFVSYRRLGSCCMFKTQNGTFGDTGLLDMYELSYDGIEEPVILYINMYDSDHLQVPVGFRLIYE
ncbi:2-dehydro-3-deoxyphosphooctonate aldolase [Natronoflexus pectinivorans]|uniref:2-dehydro-3-deoxyphosphooctonate aldolase n=1 Tax=Natronoflexus pectinivorans TaxID=682526 RepID=A0A4R2GIA2_9BACT|nr:2-dehydro-3-deoxyphosphooctonate aldolase [Natronoflexus pectinivorans]TCO08228.1 hypothetical protein EV194_10530 [Natronoflexus pectinivorans]